MKKQFLPAVLIALFSLAIVSCSKDKDDKKVEEQKPAPDYSKCRITRLDAAPFYLQYTYDASGRIISEAGSFEDGESTTNYEYVSPTEVRISTVGEHSKVTLTLNGSGNAIKRVTSNFEGPDSTVVTSGVTEEYTYNADGYLISTQTTFSGPGSSNSNVETNTWTNGNLTSSITVYSSGTTSTTTYTYYTDKLNSSALTDQLLDFTGKQSKNLRKSAAYPNDNVSYTYEFDGDGKITKATESNGVEGATYAISWSCQ